ncbi:MAG: AAA family ATPase [Chloroflexota bacterium]
MKKYNFPILKNVKINHFSLYKKTDYLDIDLSKNVYCLAGANGLGKSTFITIINYAITGIVKHPDRDFTWYNSIAAFYNRSKGFAANYFDGRISEENYDLAEVCLEFSIDDIEYTITRGFFEPDELRLFSKKVKGKEIEISEQTTNTDLNDLFKTHFTKDVNLSEFDQFVFLQTYLFTFDETHQLLFWNESLIERVLYLFFGVDADKAKLADQLRKEYNKFDSEVRNLQFQITRTRTQLNSVQKSMEEIDMNKGSNIELYETHKALREKSDELTSQLKWISEEIKDADLNIADTSLRASAMRSEYETLFNQTLTNDTPIEKNPTVIQILKDLKLRIFNGNDFTDLIESLVNTIKEQQKKATGKNSKELFEQLKIIDTQLADFSKKIKSSQTKKDRLIEQEKNFTVDLNDVNSEIQKIEKDNEELLRSIHKFKSDGGIQEILKSYQNTIEQLTAQKEEAYRKRNKARQELEPLEIQMNKGYIDAEEEFIPKFNQYAKSFLGLDIDISLASSVKGASLSINIENTKRKVAHQLSESQRYFVDIAIRMALIELCTNSATVLIDTPEGSLDIAYESRAGKMFADFAKDSYKVILTANINSSQLLKELATICKKKKMTIERMTEWTTLSEVQQKENHRIEEAFSELEKILS